MQPEDYISSCFYTRINLKDLDWSTRGYFILVYNKPKLGLGNVE